MTKKSRQHIYDLVSVGQNLSASEKAIQDAGYTLYYEKAVTPTIKKDYLMQLVIIGDTTRNIMESHAYAAQLKWLPFTHLESPYLVITADLDGTITKLD